MRLLETRFPDLALVDIGLPDASGLDVLRRVREADGIVSRVDPSTPFVLLTGRDGELDRVRGFVRGADVYVCKPFSYAELHGRMAAILRRTQPRQSLGRLRVGDLEIDPPSREVRGGQRPAQLVARPRDELPPAAQLAPREARHADRRGGDRPRPERRPGHDATAPSTSR